MISNRGGLLGLEFEVMGVPQVSRILSISMERVKDLSPAFEQIADDFYKGEAKVFRMSGAVGQAAPENPVGTWERWKPINPDYARWKRKHGFSSKILVKTGRLMASLTSDNGDGSIRVINKLSMEIGTAVPYAKYHQDARPPRTKREPMRITKKQARFWVQLINLYLLNVGDRDRRYL